MAIWEFSSGIDNGSECGRFMEEGSGVEPHAQRHPWVSNPVASHLAVPSWRMERRPRLELGKTGFAIPRFDRFSIRRLAGDPRFELGNGGFGVRRSPKSSLSPLVAPERLELSCPKTPVPKTGVYAFHHGAKTCVRTFKDLRRG